MVTREPASSPQAPRSRNFSSPNHFGFRWRGASDRLREVELIAIGIGHDVTRYFRRAVTIVERCAEGIKRQRDRPEPIGCLACLLDVFPPGDAAAAAAPQPETQSCFGSGAFEQPNTSDVGHRTEDLSGFRGCHDPEACRAANAASQLRPSKKRLGFSAATSISSRQRALTLI